MTIETLCSLVLGKKFEVFKALCERADSNNFVFVKIDDLTSDLGLSKPTVLAAFRLLEEKRLLRKLKNGLYELGREREISNQEIYKDTK